MNQRKLVAFVLTSILFLPLLSCGGHDADEKYFLISANIKIPYWEMAGAGLSQAASKFRWLFAESLSAEPVVRPWGRNRLGHRIWSAPLDRKQPGRDPRPPFPSTVS